MQISGRSSHIPFLRSILIIHPAYFLGAWDGLDINCLLLMAHCMEHEKQWMEWANECDTPEVKVAQLDIPATYLLHAMKFSIFLYSEALAESKAPHCYALHAYQIQLTSDTAERPWKDNSSMISQDCVSTSTSNGHRNQRPPKSPRIPINARSPGNRNKLLIRLPMFRQ